MPYKVLVDAVCIESSDVVIEGKERIVLRKFQAETIDFFCSNNKLLFLEAPTGSGKTFTLTTPLLANIVCGTYYDGALGIYPTKPLTADQFISIRNILSKLGGKQLEKNNSVVIYETGFTVNIGGITKSWNGKIGLVLLTRDNLEKLSESLNKSTRRDILQLIRDTLINEPIDYLITVAVPEYPYLMFSSLYRSYPDMGKLLSLVSDGGFVYRLAKKLSVLSGDELTKEVNRIYKIIRDIIGGRGREREFADIAATILPKVMFLDEFHTWKVFEKPTVLSLVLMHHLLSKLTTFPENYRVVFSSATPQQNIVRILRQVVSNKMSVIKADIINCGKPGAVKIRGKTEVEFIPKGRGLHGPVAWLVLDKYLHDVVAEKAHEIVNAKRAIVFGRHIYSVERAARVFRDITGITPVVVTGVKPPEGFLGREHLPERKEHGELYLFGNYSIELGIDLSNIQYAIVVATTQGEFVQRMGRSGRGGIDSKLVVPIPEHYLAEILHHLSTKQDPISYQDFINILSLILPSELIVERVAGRTILSHRLDKLRMYLPIATLVLSVIHRFRDKPEDIKEMLREFVKVVDAVDIPKIFRWMRFMVSKNPYVLTEIASFRTGLSVPYVRRENYEKNPDTVDGEDDFISLLANYSVLIDRSRGKPVLILNSPRRVSPRYISVINLRTIDKTLLESLYGMVIASDKLLDILPVETRIRNPVVEIMKSYRVPVYVAKPYTTPELLHVFGQAIKLDLDGEPQAYLILL